MEKHPLNALIVKAFVCIFDGSLADMGTNGSTMGFLHPGLYISTCSADVFLDQGHVPVLSILILYI